MARTLLALVVGFLALRASADSVLRFERPALFGVTNAEVLDASGKRVGSARFEVTESADGRVHLRTSTRLDSGQGSETEAMLAPRENRSALALVSEHSKTFSAGGVLAIETRIDHVAARVRCSGAKSDGGELALAAKERIANVPVKLLLRPLALTAQSELEVNVAVCRGEPRIMTMRAERKGSAAWPGRARVVEIEYGPTGWLGALAGLLMPRASFWFDPSEPAPWLAHRLPLEPGGAAVIVVREGVKLAPGLLGAEKH